ncbi:MAG TPA: DNA polymerase III subunit gamma/tau [Rectinemataceae bacterium]|nr:DNA polymerase III subunit gamma/tau [Rectinemataceae bacterium]
MPYEITATRKRPQTFEELAGQEFVSATLEASLESGRLAHAYLFSGPRGCGKTSTARIVAKALNCERGPTAKPCGSCRSCVEIARGASLDVIEIDGASNTSVDNVRQIKDEVLFPPNGGRYKIYIIDEVHMLSNSAFNALLKTIEEPPPYIVFIFATTELHKVPATIKSRCQQFAFRLISIDVIKELLAKAAEETGLKAEDDALLWIAKESGGSLRDAYTLFDQVSAFSEGSLSAALIRDKLGLVGMDALNELFRFCASGEGGPALGALDGILERGVSVEQCTVDAVEYFRSLLLLKHGIVKPGLLGAPPSAFDALVVEALSSERIERALALLLDLYRNLRFTVDQRFELELTVARLARLSDYVSPGELATTVAELRRSLAGGGLPGGGYPGGGPAPGGHAESRVVEGAGGHAAEQKKKPELNPALMEAFGSLAAATGAAEPRSFSSPRPQPAESTPPVAEKEAAPDQAKPRPGDTGPAPGEGRQASGDTTQDAGNTTYGSVAAGAREPVSMEALRSSVIEALGRSSPLLKTGLSASLPWRGEGERLVIPFRSGMEETVVRSSLSSIAAKVAEIGGRPFKVELRVEAAANPGREAKVADARESQGAVKVVERVFRGTRLPPRQQQEGEHNELV